LKKSVIAFLLIMFPFTVLSSQTLIPRRILYVEKNIALSGTDNFPVLPLLNARLSDYNSVIPVKEGERYHNIIIVEYGEDSLSFTLEDLDGKIESDSYKIDGSFESIEKACASVAALWKDYLGPAKPFTEDVFVQEKQTLEKEVKFDESLSTHYSISYWVTAVRTAEDPGTSASEYGYFFPNILDFDWFHNPTWGFNLSVYWDYSDFMVFDFTEGVENHTFSNALLFGAGISYRTLGRLSGEYGFTYYVGNIWADVLDDQDNVVADETLSYTQIAVKSGISYNFNKLFSVRVRIAVYIAGSVFTQSESNLKLDMGSLFHTDLQIGAGLRW